MKPDLRRTVSCRGLRQRAYTRRILCETQPVASVRTGIRKTEDHAVDERSQCGRGRIRATSQTPMALTFRLGLGVVTDASCRPRGSKDRRDNAKRFI